MTNPPVMVCYDCNEYFEVGCVGEEEWAKKHMTHTTGICPENCVSGMSGILAGFKDAARKEVNR